MALPDFSVGIPQREITRIQKELDKVQALADPSFRGASAGSVTRYALNRTGTVARKILRSSVPVGGAGRRSSQGRFLKQTGGGLKKSVGGRVIKTNNGLVYKAGFERKKLRRWQQAVALEFGTSYVSPRRYVSRALQKAAGSSGEKLRKIFVQEMDKRIARLIVNANRKSGRGL